MSKERQRRRAALEAQRAKPGARGKGAGKPAAGKGAAGTAGAPTSTGKGKATSTRITGGARPAPGRPSGGPRGAGKRGKPTVYRQRRFKPLPTRLKAALALGWLAVLVLVLVFVPTWTARIGLMVIATMLLPLIVVLVRDPTRRTR